MLLFKAQWIEGLFMSWLMLMQIENFLQAPALKVNMFLWIGQRGLLFAVVQLLVLCSFMKRLNQTLFTEISRPATYCWMRTSIQKLEILVLQNFFLIMSPMLVLELQGLCKYRCIIYINNTVPFDYCLKVSLICL